MSEKGESMSQVDQTDRSENDTLEAALTERYGVSSFGADDARRLVEEADMEAALDEAANVTSAFMQCLALIQQAALLRKTEYVIEIEDNQYLGLRLLAALERRGVNVRIGRGRNRGRLALSVSWAERLPPVADVPERLDEQRTRWNQAAESREFASHVRNGLRKLQDQADPATTQTSQIVRVPPAEEFGVPNE